MTKIISLQQAKAQRATPAQIEAIAVWHAEKSNADFDHHDMMAFRFFRLANQLRVA